MCRLPSVDELTSAMERHDLFVYLGHGCGSEVIPRYELNTLEKCPAMFLLGCESAACALDESYTPNCFHVSYIMVGSPFVIGNLWIATDFDLDKFIGVIKTS